jgi:hypothetical protein
MSDASVALKFLVPVLRASYLQGMLAQRRGEGTLQEERKESLPLDLIKCELLH